MSRDSWRFGRMKKKMCSEGTNLSSSSHYEENAYFDLTCKYNRQK